MNRDSLIEFSYISKATNPMVTLQLIQLFDRAYKFNQAQGITGVLFYEKQYFAQILEGNDHTVSSLWKRIRQDPRHEIIRELSCQNIEKRHFPNWSMRFFGAENIVKYVPQLRDCLSELPEDDVQLLTLMRSVAKLDNNLSR